MDDTRGLHVTSESNPVQYPKAFKPVRPSADYRRVAPDANWYPDPEGPGLRWWDGSAWTEHRKDAPAPPTIVPIEDPNDPDPPGSGEVAASSTESAPITDVQPGAASVPSNQASSDGQTGGSTGLRPVPGYEDVPDPPTSHQLARIDWTATRPEPTPTRDPTKGMGSRLTVLIAAAVIALLLLIFGHHGGSSDSSHGSAAAEPAPTKLETYEEQYEAAHDAVCEHVPYKYEPECQ